MSCRETGGTRTVYVCIAGELWETVQAEYECDGEMLWKDTSSENTNEPCPET